MQHNTTHVCVQPATAAVNVTLPAFAAAAPLLLGARRPPLSITGLSLASWPPSSKPAAHATAAFDQWNRRTDGRTDVGTDTRQLHKRCSAYSVNNAGYNTTGYVR